MKLHLRLNRRTVDVNKSYGNKKLLYYETVKKNHAEKR